MTDNSAGCVRCVCLASALNVVTNSVLAARGECAGMYGGWDWAFTLAESEPGR